MFRVKRNKKGDALSSLLPPTGTKISVFVPAEILIAIEKFVSTPRHART